MLFDLLSGHLDTQTAISLLTRLFIVFLILPLHEYAHAWTAHKLGDDTALYQGRLTLNPIAHIDPIGALCLLLGGFGWAKPVPIDPSRFTRKHSMRFGVALTALAGPLANLLAALVGMIAYQFYVISDYYNDYIATAADDEITSGAPMLVMFMLFSFISINIGLCVFNHVPIPPLDGSKIASYFTSGKFDNWFIRNEQIVRIVFLFLIVTPVLSIPLTFIEGLVFRLLQFLTSWIPALFG